MKTIAMVLGYALAGAMLLEILTGCAGAGATSAPAARSGPAVIAGDPAKDWVRLYDEPCPQTIAWLRLRRAEMVYQGKHYAACWLQAESHVLIFDSAGDLSDLPVHAFRKDQTT